MMLELLNLIRPIIDPLAIPLCFLGAWGMTIFLIISSCRWVFFSWSRVKMMHQIPCSCCTFFTGEYHLKCTVRPDIALSEEAIQCPDFCRFPPTSR